MTNHLLTIYGYREILQKIIVAALCTGRDTSSPAVREPLLKEKPFGIVYAAILSFCQHSGLFPLSGRAFSYTGLTINFDFFLNIAKSNNSQ